MNKETKDKNGMKSLEYKTSCEKIDKTLIEKKKKTREDQIAFCGEIYELILKANEKIQVSLFRYLYENLWKMKEGTEEAKIEISKKIWRIYYTIFISL